MAQNNKQTVAQDEGTVGTTLMLPASLWKRVRNLSTDRRTSAVSIWIEAMNEYLDRHAQRSDAA